MLPRLLTATLLWSFTLCAAFAVVAAPSEANERCSDHQILSFKTRGLSNFQQDLDYCQVDDAQLPQVILGSLNQVIQHHRDVAQLLGVNEAELLSQGIHLEVLASPLGPLDSSAEPNWVRMAVFADWPGSRFDPAEPLGAGTYLHELGHVISANAANRLPAIIHALAAAPSFKKHLPTASLSHSAEPCWRVRPICHNA